MLVDWNDGLYYGKKSTAKVGLEQRIVLTTAKKITQKLG